MVAVVLILIEIIILIFDNEGAIKWVSNLIKIAAYGFLAWSIYYYIKVRNNDISYFTFFTFVLCCIETADNLGELIKLVVDHIREIKNIGRLIILHEQRHWETSAFILWNKV